MRNLHPMVGMKVVVGEAHGIIVPPCTHSLSR